MKTRSTTRACRPWRDRLLDALDAEQAGRSEATAAAALTAHLETCPGCASELAALRRTLARLAEHQPAAPPAAYWTTLRANVIRGLAVETPPRRSPLRARLAWGSLAAAALLLVALAWWQGRQPEPAGNPRPRLAEQPVGLRALGEQLAASDADLEVLLAEGQSLVPEEDPEQLLEELTAAELVELAARLDGLSS
jgi:anti-sigma factor RsiW